MSELPTGAEAAPAAPGETPPSPKVDKLEQAERVIKDILRLMAVPARLEVKEVAPVKPGEGKLGSEGGISVALFLEAEVPGVQPGRRSHVIDALQFLANKIVNRPQTERKWISIGVGGHPEPRPAPPPRAQGAAAPRPSAPPGAPPPVQAPRREARPMAKAAAPAQRPAAAPPPEVAGPAPEETLEVAADPAVEALGRALFEKAAKLGRLYAVAFARPEDRAKMVRGARGLSGASVKLEGEGRNRRLVFVPDKPAPMPKRAIPDYGDEEG